MRAVVKNHAEIEKSATDERTDKAVFNDDLIASVLLIIGFGGWAVMANCLVRSSRQEIDQNRQIVQHPDGGVVAEILVDEGDTVQNGDVLIRLDPRAEKSELSIIQGQLFELMARRGRLIAERDNLDRVTFDPKLIAAAATDPAIDELWTRAVISCTSCQPDETG